MKHNFIKLFDITSKCGKVIINLILHPHCSKLSEYKRLDKFDCPHLNINVKVMYGPYGPQFHHEHLDPNFWQTHQNINDLQNLSPGAIASSNDSLEASRLNLIYLEILLTESIIRYRTNMLYFDSLWKQELKKDVHFAFHYRLQKNS